MSLANRIQREDYGVWAAGYSPEPESILFVGWRLRSWVNVYRHGTVGDRDGRLGVASFFKICRMDQQSGNQKSSSGIHKVTSFQVLHMRDYITYSEIFRNYLSSICRMAGSGHAEPLEGAAIVG